ncbi:hypothetical protein TNCV_5037601 [Trichonephila clavipes]|nr:hypothetical protein TNCV_5037601 [Trichonephila clavipes]
MRLLPLVISTSSLGVIALSFPFAVTSQGMLATLGHDFTPSYPKTESLPLAIPHSRGGNYPFPLAGVNGRFHSPTPPTLKAHPSFQDDEAEKGTIRKTRAHIHGKKQDNERNFFGYHVKELLLITTPKKWIYKSH